MSNSFNRWSNPSKGLSEKMPIWISSKHNSSFYIKILSSPITWILFCTLAFIGVLTIFMLSFLSGPGGGNLILISSSYHDNINMSENIEGQRGLNLISNWLQKNNLNNFKVSEGIISPSKKEIFKFPKIANNKKPIVVFVSLVADADEKGVFFWKSDASIRDDDKGKFRLETILEEFKKLPNSTSKILVIDPISNQKIIGNGGLSSVFLESISTYTDIIENIPNLVVLSGITNDTLPWDDEIRGFPIFWKQILNLLFGSSGSSLKTKKPFLEKSWSFDSVSTKEIMKTENILLLPIKKLGYDRLDKICSELPRINLENYFEDLEKNQNVELITKTAWKNHVEFMSDITKPWVYAPDLWRDYERYCIRLEELKLKGAETESVQLMGKIKEIERELDSKKNDYLLSESVGFQFSSLIAVPNREEIIATQLMQKLDKGQISDIKASFDKLWKEGISESQILRILKIIAQKKIENAVNLPSVSIYGELEKIETIKKNLSFLPNELMTATVFDPRKNIRIKNLNVINEFEPYFENLMKVKLISEKASSGINDSFKKHCYSEKTWPFFCNDIFKIDSQRGLSQDLFASSTTKDLQEFSELSKNSLFQYDQIINKCEKLNLAWETRDLIANYLPWVTHWLLNENPKDLTDKDGIIWDKNIELLWEKYHKLNLLLIKIPIVFLDKNNNFEISNKNNINEEIFKEIISQTESLKLTYNYVNENLLKFASDLTDQQSFSNLIHLNLLLQTPIFPVTVREKLNLHLIKMKKELFSRLISDKERKDFIELSRQNDSSQKHYRNTKLWLSWYGFNLKEYHDSVADKILDEVLNLASKMRFSESKNDIYDLKIKIKKNLLDFTSINENAISLLQSKFTTMNNDNNFNPINTSYENLRRNDAYFRTLPLNGFLNLKTPTKQLWEAEARDFLCWQVIRIWHDHLHFPELNSKSYYSSAIEILLNDIKKLKGPSDLINFSKYSLDKTNLSLVRAAQQGEIITGVKKEIPWTYENKRTFSIYPKIDETVFKTSGKVSIWADLDGNIEAYKEQKLEGIHLKINETVNQTSTWNLDLCLKNKSTQKDEEEDLAQINFKGFYRGKILELKVPLEIRNKATTSYIEKITHPKGSLAIRTDWDLNKTSQSTGAVVFIIDCSGSMGLPPGIKDYKESKYFQAISGLEKVLKVLPNGLKVSVWIFGQAVGDEKSTNEPESYIRQIIPQQVWDPSNTEMLNLIISQLMFPKIQPWNSSPIIRSISKAIKDFDNIEGGKFLIAFTDGLDNRIHNDKVINPNSKQASEVLFSILDGTGIQSQIISFKAIESEESEMRKQFSSIEQLEPPGYFVKAENIEEVASKINKFLNPQLKVQIDNLYNLPVKSINENYLEITTLGNGDKWFLNGLKAGYYNIRLSNYPGIRSIIKIDENDRLLLQLKKQNDIQEFKPYFEKYNWAKNDFSKRISIEKQGWHSSVLSSKYQMNDYSFLVSLDKLAEKDQSVLSIIKPREIWWEINSDNGNKQNFISKISRRFDYPGNVWQFDIKGNFSNLKLDNLSPPKLSAWWTINQEVPFTVKLVKGIDYESWADLEGRYIDIDGKRILIKNCSLDEYPILSETGEFKKTKCFVIAITHPIDFPLILKTESVTSLNKEGHFYKGTGQTIYAFYPVGIIPPLPTSLEFIPVERIKNNAEKNGLFLDFNSLPQPDSSDFYPDPILLPK